MADVSKEPRDQSTIEQIVIERVAEADGSSGWVWDAFGQESRIIGGAAPTLARILESVSECVRNNPDA